MAHDIEPVIANFLSHSVPTRCNKSWKVRRKKETSPRRKANASGPVMAPITAISPASLTPLLTCSERLIDNAVLGVVAGRREVFCSYASQLRFLRTVDLKKKVANFKAISMLTTNSRSS